MEVKTTHGMSKKKNKIKKIACLKFKKLALLSINL